MFYERTLKVRSAAGCKQAALSLLNIYVSIFLCFYLSMNDIVYKSYKENKVRRGARVCVCVFVGAVVGGRGWDGYNQSDGLQL